ncbi:MAG: hypothetical protein J6R64_02210, partial [Lentisphaeria bacterium]|nr:hypothetical protein [Lentisphaeria bacterium]
ASLDESIGEDGSQTRGDTIQSKELSPEDAAIMKNAKARLAVWLQSLSETDRKIIAIWKAVKNLRAVGAAVGKSHEFVRQRLAKLQGEALKAMEVSGEFQQRKGSKIFGEVKAALPAEQGEAPLFNEKYRGVSEILPKLAKIFQEMPPEIIAADGAKVLINNKEEGSLKMRFLHLLKSKDTSVNTKDRTSYGIKNKIPWLPRVPETLAKAQAKLESPKSGNFLYVRAYTEGGIHAVIVTKEGVVEGSEVYDHGLLTQFLLPEDSTKDSYKVVWEKEHPVENASFQGATAQRSEGNDPYRQASDMGNIAPTLSEIKSLYEKNDEISHRGVTWQDPVSLKTIITLFEKADSSTLIHEIAHYCFNSMEEAIRLGVADQRMIDDFNALKKWAESNPESMVNSAIRKLREESKDAPRNYKKFFDRLKKDEKKTKAELLALVQAMNEGTQPDRKLTRSEQFILQYVATEKLCYD